VPLRSDRNSPALALAALLVGSVQAEPLPAEWWWYWDRPASQLPVPRPGVGAAVLTRHVYFSGGRVITVARRSALTLPPGIVSIPLIHVEVDPAQPFAGTDEQRNGLRDVVVAEALARRSPLIQLDFEARQSQRPFWKAAVQAIRHPRATAGRGAALGHRAGELVFWRPLARRRAGRRDRPDVLPAGQGERRLHRTQCGRDSGAALPRRARRGR